MADNINHEGVLYGDGQLGPFPTHLLKRVDKPTNLITDDWQRVDQREIAYEKAKRGEYGAAAKREIDRCFFSDKYPLSLAQGDLLFHLANFKDNEVAPSVAPISDDPAVLTRHIKRLGYFLTADIVGVCKVPPSAVYSHDMKGEPIHLDYKYAIVIVMRKEHQTTEASSGRDWIGDPVSFQSYQRLALASHTIANYIKRLGYPASPQHPPSTVGRYKVQMPPLLLWAGIGEVSRVGIILNPFLGLAYKAAAVLTDMPLVPDKPIDFGLQDFCRQCKICAEFCPSHAIADGDKTMYNGYETWKVNTQRCASFSIMNKGGTICNTCVKVCPWSNPYTWTHNIVRWTVQRSSLARKIAIKATRMSHPEKPHDDEKWWFDLEYRDGKLVTPVKNGGNGDNGD